MVFSAKFWGTRGSVASPGESTVRYGGNTCCVEVRCGEQVIILDAGTGIRCLGHDLELQGITDVSLLVSHTHMDHIQGFPFFTPLYNRSFKLCVYGPVGGAIQTSEALCKQMESYYFPVPFQDLPARVRFQSYNGSFLVGPVSVQVQELNHPGGSRGFRIGYADKTLVYLTDHEPYSSLYGDTEYSRERDRNILEFTRGADLLIREAQYTVEEYPARRGWGHGTFDMAARDAAAAGVKRLAIFHHDPAHSDRFLEDQLARLQDLFRSTEMEIFMAREGATVWLE